MDCDVAAVVELIVAVVYSERGDAPIKVLPSENTSNWGKPEESFTTNKEPDNWSSIANNSPKLPTTLNTVEPLPTTSRGLLEPDTTKLPVISVLPSNPTLPVALRT